MSSSGLVKPVKPAREKIEPCAPTKNIMPIMVLSFGECVNGRLQIAIPISRIGYTSIIYMAVLGSLLEPYEKIKTSLIKERIRR